MANGQISATFDLVAKDMTLNRNNSDHAAQRNTTMHPDWSSFWTDESQLEKLLGETSPSEFQRHFLQQLKPIEVPALAFEISKVGLRRRPEFAISLLSSRLRRWENLLNPLLRKEGTFASGLKIKDLDPFLQVQDLFFPETWLVMHEAPRKHGGQPFELFRQTEKPVDKETIRKELEKLHSQLNEVIQERLPLPTHEWWLSIKKLSLTKIDQIGIDFTPTASRWNFVFRVSQPKALFKKINIPEKLQSCLREFPITIGVDSRFSANQNYVLNVYPKETEHKKLDFLSENERSSFQWPQWPDHTNLLPNSRLSAIAMSSIYQPSVDYGKQKIAIHGGVSRQSIVIRQGKIHDHRACIKVMVKSAKYTQNS